MKQLLLIIGLVAVFGCKKEPDTTPVPEAVPTETIVEAAPATQSPADPVATFATDRDNISRQLKGLSEKEANALYEKHLADNWKKIEAVNVSREKFMDQHQESFFSETPVKALEAEKQVLAKAGLEFRYIGEGMVIVETLPDYYKTLFGSYVTPAYKDYIALDCESNKTLWTADAGVIVPWKDLGEHTVLWEKLADRYPESRLYPKMKEEYDWFSSLFFTGEDNTPVKEDDSAELYEEVRKAFEGIVKKYPDTKTAKLAKIALTNEENGEDYLKSMFEALKAL